jgi:hypothetical protein
MTYSIRRDGDCWRLLRHGAIIATFRTKAEAKLGLIVEQKRRGEL